MPWVLVSDEFHEITNSHLWSLQNGEKNRKHPLSIVSVDDNTLSMRAVRGEWPGWFEQTGRLQSLNPLTMVSRKASLNTQHVKPQGRCEATARKTHQVPGYPTSVIRMCSVHRHAQTGLMNKRRLGKDFVTWSVRVYCSPVFSVSSSPL